MRGARGRAESGVRDSSAKIRPRCAKARIGELTMAR